MDGRDETVVPVIDLGQFPTQSGKLLEACETLGCFRLVNHRIPLQLMSEMKSVVRYLHDLPTETKSRNTDIIPGSGYVGPTLKSPLYEALGLCGINSSEAADVFCNQLDVNLHHRETIKSYVREVHNLASDIGHKIAAGLGIEGDVCREWPIHLRINKYSFTEESVGSQAIQLHTDSSFLTILQEDERVGGLELMDKSGKFIPINAIPGSFLVNLGDVAKAWSNGRLCNVKHIVQCKEAATRVTIAVFLLGPKEKAVEVPPELVDSDHPRRYLPFIYDNYRKLRISEGLYCGEALGLYTMHKA